MMNTIIYKKKKNGGGWLNYAFNGFKMFFSGFSQPVSKVIPFLFLP